MPNMKSGSNIYRSLHDLDGLKIFGYLPVGSIIVFEHNENGEKQISQPYTALLPIDKRRISEDWNLRRPTGVTAAQMEKHMVKWLIERGYIEPTRLFSWWLPDSKHAGLVQIDNAKVVRHENDKNSKY